MKSKKTAILIILMLPLLLLYQNCSCSAEPRFDGGSSHFASGMEGSTSGNGQPYEGKPEPGIYYRVIPEFKCAGRLAVYGEIEVTTNEVKLRSTNAVDCSRSEQTLSLQDLESPIYNRAFLGHKDGIFERLESPPVLDGAEVVVNESWCRLENTSSRAVGIVVKESLPSEAMTVVLRSASLSSSGSLSTDPEQIVKVARRFENRVLLYRGDGLEINIDTSAESPSNPGKFRGELTSTSGGQIRKDAILCRTGAKFDSQSQVRPTLALDLTSPPLPASISFARASQASYFDASGLLRFAPAGQPRFDYDPASLSPKGLLIEQAATNELTSSSELTDAWIVEATKSAKSGTAPDGSGNAVKLIESASGGSVVHQCGYDATLAPNTLYTASYFAKAGTRQATEMGVTNLSGTMERVSFSLSNGAPIETPNGGFIKSASAQPIKSGWYRISVVFDSGTGSAQPLISLRSHNGSANLGGMYAGDGTSFIYLWGAQLETGAVATSYIEATTGPTTRAADSALLSNFAWFNPSEGALMIQAGRAAYEPSLAGTAQPSLFDLQGTGTESYSVVSSSVPSFNFVATLASAVGGSSQVQASLGSLPSPATLHKTALAYKAADSALIAFGSAQAFAANAPTGFAPSALHIGGASGQSKWNGNFKAITYWPSRLSNETLIDLAR